MFFMDYLATGKLEPEVAEKIVEGIAEACKHNGCALIGGETAEMPGFYTEGEYDLAGFIVGVVDKERIITGKAVEIGDIILGLETVQREAAEQGISIQHHVQHLVVHGILHLLGYDHETPTDAERMEAIEIDILSHLGISNPYTGELETGTRD